MPEIHRFDPVSLEGLIHKAMALWEVPGLALGITLGDELVHLQGYGTKDIGNDAPVGQDTQFRICSLTKSFTAAGLATLVDERRLDWNTKVRNVLPDFQLRDATATEELTVDHLLAHRIGLPRHDRIWSPPGPRSRQQMLDALRYLEPTARHGESFQYSNLGYVVAGTIAERISGRSWEDFTTHRLLAPLGFTSYGFTQEALESAPDHAHPHDVEKHKAIRGKVWPMRATPAGGICTSASDLTRWMRLLLSQGRFGGEQLISQASIEAMMTPRVHAGNSRSAEIGEIRYGYGLFCQQYRGMRTVTHTGSQPGWNALMSMMPDHRIGVVVLTNQEPNPVGEIIVYAVYDQLLSLAPIDWFDMFQRRRLAALQQEEVEARELASRPTPPLRALPADLAGEYRHPGYGSICVEDVPGENGTPGFQWTWRGLGGMLEYQGDDRYRLRENGFPRLSPLFVSCETAQDGRVIALRSPLEPDVADIVFQRV